MDYLLIGILIGAFFIASTVIGLIVGIHYGQKIQRGERIELPRIEPIKAIKRSIEESKEDKKQKEEQKEIDEWVAKMEAYDPMVVTK